MATKWDTALEGARGLPCPALIGSMRVSPPRGLPDRIRRSAPWQNVINGRVAAAGHRPTDTTLPSCGLGLNDPSAIHTASGDCPGLRGGELLLRQRALATQVGQTLETLHNPIADVAGGSLLADEVARDRGRDG